MAPNLRASSTTRKTLLRFSNLWIVFHWVLYLLWSHFCVFINSVRIFFSFSRNVENRFRLPPPPPHVSDRFSPSPQPVCIITGATSGIGRASAELLASKGFHVILGCRSLKRGKEVAEQIKKRFPGAKTDVFFLDLCEPNSVSFFVDKIKVLFSKNRLLVLRVLVNNAGILTFSKRTTDFGSERTIGTNLLGPVYLSLLLLPLLSLSSPASRIINVVSFTHRAVRKMYVDYDSLMAGGTHSLSSSPSSLSSFSPLSAQSSLSPLPPLSSLVSLPILSSLYAPFPASSLPSPSALSSSASPSPLSSRSSLPSHTSRFSPSTLASPSPSSSPFPPSSEREPLYSPANTYQNSKLGLLFMSKEFHEKYFLNFEKSPISTIYFDPGLVDTKILRELPTWLSLIGRIAMRALGLMVGPATAGEGIYRAAMAPPEISGVYCFGKKGTYLSPSKLSNDDSLAKSLCFTVMEVVRRKATSQ